jgi:hypothetical protein
MRFGAPLGGRSVAFWTIAGGVASVVAVVITLITMAAQSAPNVSASGAPETAVGQTPSSSLATPAVAEGSSTDAANRPPTGASSSSPNVLYLSDEQPLGGAEPDTTTIPYLVGISNDAHSLSTDTGGCARNQDNTFVYTINGYSIFRTTLALQSTHQAGSPNRIVKVLVTVSLDDSVAYSTVLNVGDQVPIELSVKNHSTIELRQQYRGDYPNTCYTPATVFWADAQLVGA